MLRRTFLCRLGGILGGLVGLGVQSMRADVPVPCPYCRSPSMPRRRYQDATEYACFECGGQLPLGAYMFTRKANDPNYYAFFPADIEAAFRDTPFEPAWPNGTGWSLMENNHLMA